jgi:hypothetical protein
MLGDRIEQALLAVGITKDRVEHVVGGPCGCKERQQKLNAISAWAERVLSGKIELARNYLNDLLNTSF